MRTFMVAVFVLIAAQAHGTRWVTQPPSVYFDSAEVVARVRVVKAEAVERELHGTPVWCTVEVVADVVDSLKGSSGRIRFQANGLNPAIGEEYLVFLDAPGGPTVSPLASTSSVSAEAKARHLKACAGVASGLQASWLSASRFISRWSEESSEYESWLMPAHNIRLPDNSGVVVRKVKLRALEVDGEVISREFWSVSDGIPIPHLFWMYKGAYEWKSYRRFLLLDQE